MLVNFQLLVLTAAAIAKPTIYVASDSTAAYFNPGFPHRGWGMYLHEFINTTRFDVQNVARSGSSTRSWIEDPNLLQSLEQKLVRGDIVVLEFGHNDAQSYRRTFVGTLPGVGNEKENVTVQGKNVTVRTFGYYTRVLVDRIRAKGAIPILSSMIPRMIWNEELNQLEEGEDTPSGKGHAEMFRKVAEARGVKYVDHFTSTARSLTTRGKEGAFSAFVAEGARPIHTNFVGAVLSAEAFISALKCSIADLDPDTFFSQIGANLKSLCA